MKKISQKFKRSAALLLAVVTFLSSANLNAVGRVSAAETDEKQVTLGQLIVDNYGELSTQEQAIINSELLTADQSFSYILPPEEVKDGNAWISVDEKEKTVYVKEYKDDEGNQWVPVSFVLKNGETVVEGPKTIEEGKGQYKHAGNTFSVVVTYKLELTVEADEQQAMLDAAYALAQDIAVLKHLDDTTVELGESLSGMVPPGMKVTANSLLSLFATKLEQLGDAQNPKSVIDLIKELADGITYENPVPDGEDIIFKIAGTLNINAANALYDQQQTNGALDLYRVLSEHSKAEYLELLMSYGSELEAALTDNYDDIYRLATNANALPGVDGQMELVEEELETTLAAFTAERDAALKDLNAQAAQYGYTETIETPGDIDELLKFIDGKIKEAEDTYASALGAVIEQIPAQVITQSGYGKEIKTLADLDDFIECLEGHSLSYLFTSQINTLKEASAGLHQLRNTIDNTIDALEDTKDTLEKGKAQLLQFEAAESLANGLKTELAAKRTQLQMLIEVLKAFCNTVEPTYDAFKNDSFNTPNVVKDTATAADYAMLSRNAEGLSENTTAVKNHLFVMNSDVKYNMSMYNVTVTYNAEIIDPSKADSKETLSLTPYETTVTLRKGATSEEILAAIAAKVNEDDVLANWGIDKANYDRTASELPETLTEDIKDYTISYTPTLLTVTYGAGFDGKAAEELPYGYKMTLEAHKESGKEYVYTVGQKGNINQGSIITITEDVTISREEGDASASQYINDLIVKTGTITDEESIAILLSEALKKTGAISIRVPSDKHVSVVRASGMTTVTAEEVASRVADLLWIAKTGSYDKTNFNFTNGVYTTPENPAKFLVNFELELTAAALGLTGEELLEVMNIPYELRQDYLVQRERLNALVKQLDNLAKLNNTDVVAQGMTLKAALGMVESMNGSLATPLGSAALAAAKALRDLIPDQGHIALYNTLVNYREDGMIHYYTNADTYYEQIAALDEILDALMADDGFKALLAGMLSSYKSMFEDMHEAVNAAAELEADYPISELIEISSPYLSDLLGSIAEAEDAQEYKTAPDEMIWTETIEKEGAGFHKVHFSVTVGGKTYSVDESIPDGDTLTAEKLQEIIEVLIPATVKEILHHYETSHVYEDLVITESQNYTVTWTLKQYPVYVDGVDDSIDTLTCEDLKISLPAHPDSPAVQYLYYINDDSFYEGERDLKLEDLDGLLAKAEQRVDKKIVITRQEMDTRETDLSKFVEGMGGAAILTKDANGDYAVVLRVNPSDLQTSMTNFAMGLFLSSYTTIELDGEIFRDGTVFHLQTLIDSIMNSGAGTKTITTVINADGTVNHMSVPGTVIGTNYFGTELGGKMMQSTMNLDNGSYDIDVDFYITLAGSQEQMKQVRDLVTTMAQYITFICENGQAKMTVDLPAVVYEAYLAALLMVGEIDIRDFNTVTGQIVMSYLLDVLDPVLNTESGVTVTTLQNTLAKFGVVRDLSAYEKLYNKFITYYENHTLENGVCAIPLTEIPIKSFIDKMQGTVDNMQLPAGVTVDLSTMIAEYESGLDLTVAAEVANAGQDYIAVFVDVDGAGVTNKVGLLTEPELVGMTGGATAVVMLDDYMGDLYFSGTCLLDLNGKTLKSDITANGKLIIVDTAYDVATPGTVDGKVIGENAIILGGKYTTDVTANLKSGYQQDADGVVGNKLYTVTGSGNDIVVTLNATVADVKELASKTGITCLAVEMLMDVMINNYNTAGLTIAGKTLYNVQLKDLIGLYAGTNRKDTLVDTALACFSATDLGDLVDILVADLTNFSKLQTALKEGSAIASYETTTAPWALTLERIVDGDYLTLNIGAKDTAEEGTFSVVVKGDLAGDLADLAGALADTTTVKSDIALEEIVRNEADEIVVAGTYNGSVVVDFAKNPDYITMMAVILAYGSQGELREDLVAGIENCYETDARLQVMLEETFDGLTVNQVCTALKNVSRTATFTAMVKGIGLETTTQDEILKTITDSEMGFKLAIELMGMVLRRLDITGGSRTLGGLKKTDKDGKKYYGFDWDKDFAGTRSLVASYMLNYDISIESVDVKVYLFNDHEHNYKATFAWSDDLTSCQVTETCACGHTKTVDAVVKSEVTIVADDKQEGEITYTATADIDDRIYSDSKTKPVNMVVVSYDTTDIAGIKVDTDEGYLFLDLYYNGMSLNALQVGLTLDGLTEYTVAMTIEGNDGTGLVKTGDKLVITAVDSQNRIVAKVIYTLIVMGDVNSDGLALANDATAMMNIYFGKISVSDEQKLAADMNLDGLFGAVDAQRLMHKYCTWGKYQGGYESALQ